jgi:5-formyltetrahydrofolate cyclo-ligase
MDKTSLRKLYTEKRQQLSETAITAYSKAIAEQFLSILPTMHISVLHTFLPIKTKKEVNTWYIIENIWKNYSNIQVAVPIMQGNDLVHALITPHTIFKINHWNISEPIQAQTISPEQIDVVLVPLLAYDQKGNRIGYGKGFYDRFLPHCKPDIKKIGLSFFEPYTDCMTVEATDIPLNGCITPKQIHYFE